MCKYGLWDPAALATRWGFWKPDLSSLHHLLTSLRFVPVFRIKFYVALTLRASVCHSAICTGRGLCAKHIPMKGTWTSWSLLTLSLTWTLSCKRTGLLLAPCVLFFISGAVLHLRGLSPPTVATWADVPWPPASSLAMGTHTASSLFTPEKLCVDLISHSWSGKGTVLLRKNKALLYGIWLLLIFMVP